MMKLIFAVFLVLFSAPALAEDRQDIYDYYYEQLEKSGYYDVEDRSVDSYYYDDNPFNTKRTPREDRVKFQKPIKPIELDNGLTRRPKSSLDILRWQLEKHSQ